MIKKLTDQLTKITSSIDVDSVSDKIMDAGSNLGEIKENIAQKISDLDLTELKDRVLSTTSFSLPTLLASEAYYEKVVEYLNQAYHIHKENDAIRAFIDSLSHVKDYGGGQFHRIADGRHSIFGAFESVSDEFKNLEQFEKIKGVFGHLFTDLNSKTGIPLFSFDNYESFKEFCRSVHLKPELVQDLFSVNSTELIGTCLTIIPQIFNLNEMESIDFARLASKLGILTAIGQGQFEAVSGVFSLIMLGKSFYLAKYEGISIRELLNEISFEGGFTAASVLLVGFTPFPLNFIFPFLIVGIKNKVDEEGFKNTFEHYREDFNDQFDLIKTTIHEMDFNEYHLQLKDWVSELSTDQLAEVFADWTAKVRG